MSRIQELFLRKEKNILNVYCTAGFPALNSTVPVMSALQRAGADMIELGMPYSDPLADGPVIQSSSSAALANGMTLARLFQQLNDFRKEIQVPVLLMGYMNPILQYGFDRFCRDAAAAGIDGLILPDLPMFEFEKEYGPEIRRHKLDFVFLVTPETSEERIRKLDALSTGFLYAVSSSSTTGKNKELSDQSAYFSRLQAMKLSNPVLIGFGIKDRESFHKACSYAKGAIIGTAYIKALDGAAPEEIESRTKNFLNTLK
ncbi:MAG: tryptophan synthase subunit alpha [Bacteroidota bacterium]|nr:tryptophan synthase subunit alpha [Bacteroidota bacterium]MDP4211923.1 tryptophan synthase subunit alpha [Bacteroidota bacterium]MDP4249272.1 tryptophan synthase subunit alpha [Bacteroidota bacterium]